VPADETGLAQLTVTDATPGGAGVIATVTLPWTEPSTLVAVTVTDVAAVTTGAVYAPEDGIVPLDADQVTDSLKVPLPVSETVHVSEAPEASGEPQLGTTEVTFDVGVAGVEIGGTCVAVAPPPQPNAKAARGRQATNTFSAPDLLGR
jgi:hypothetical protein